MILPSTAIRLLRKNFFGVSCPAASRLSAESDAGDGGLQPDGSSNDGAPLSPPRQKKSKLSTPPPATNHTATDELIKQLSRLKKAGGRLSRGGGGGGKCFVVLLFDKDVVDAASEFGREVGVQRLSALHQLERAVKRGQSASSSSHPVAVGVIKPVEAGNVKYLRTPTPDRRQPAELDQIYL